MLKISQMTKAQYEQKFPGKWDYWLKRFEHIYYNYKSNAPKTLQNNPHFCLDIVKINPRILEHIPEKLKTYEMCLAAVSKSGPEYQYVRQSLKSNQDICNAAVKSNPFVIRSISSENKTYEMCLGVVKKHGSLLVCVPTKYKTIEMCYAALNSEHPSGADRYIPQRILQAIVDLTESKSLDKTIKNNQISVSDWFSK